MPRGGVQIHVLLMTRARSVATLCLKKVQFVRAVTCVAVARIVVSRTRAVGRGHLQQLVPDVRTRARSDHSPDQVLMQEKWITCRWCRVSWQTSWQNARMNDQILTCRHNR